MARDRSLDEFLGGGSDDGSGERSEEQPEPSGNDGPEEDSSEEVPTEGDDSGEDGSDGQADEETVDDGTAGDDTGAGSVEPAAVEATMAFAPEGADCAACGATVERRWQGERGLVCADCKEW